MKAMEERFVAEYLIDFNRTAATIRAGYSAKSASSTGGRLISDPEIRAAIEEGRRRIAEKLEVTAEMIVSEYAKIAFSDFSDYAEWGPDGVKLKDSITLNQTQTAAVAEVSETVTKEGGSIRLKLHDKKGALDALGRHLGMFVDKSEISISNLAAELDEAERRIRQAGTPVPAGESDSE